MPLYFRSSAMRLSLRILWLILAYFIAGRLSLLLAIPPGFVTGIFLPLGIALGALLIWGLPMVIGVVLGSTLLNISIALGSGQPFTLSAVLVASEIACGSGLASVIGALLIRRFVGFPNNLTDERKIFLFFILGGPVATSVSACVGAFTLYLNGIIPAHQLFYNWWTWWIGDAIGVLIATPLMCILFAEPRHFWRNRLTTVAIPLVLSSLVVVVVFVIASINEQRKLQGQFEQEARLVSGAINVGFSSVEYVLVTLSGLFIASEQVTREEFAAYVKHVITKKPGVSGFSWNQYVKNAERDHLEAELRKEGFSDFSIREKNSDGNFVVAPEREDYIVISYIEPWSDIIHGVNVSNDTLRMEAMTRARDSGNFAVTQPVQLLQDTKAIAGVIAYYPVYGRNHIPDTPGERQQLLTGYATAIVRTNDLIQEILSPFKKENYRLEISDITTPESPVIFFTMGKHQLPSYAKALVFTEEIAIGGRHLVIQLSPTEKFLRQHVSLQSWFVLAGGLLFCSLLGGFLLLVSGRTQHISDLVDQRTKELAAILENAVESILVVDENGHVQKANPAAAQLFKFPLTHFFNLPIVSLIPSLQPAFTATGSSLEIDHAREGMGLCSDGSEVPIEMSISRVEVHDRRLFTLIIHDVTARHKVDRIKSEFISTVSHELRTPLTSIKGALGIILSGNLGEVSIKIEDLLVIAKKNVDRLARLVNDILDIDKLEYNQMQFNTQPCVVYSLLQQSIDQNRGYASRYGIQLSLDVPDESVSLVRAHLDTDRFLQVMSNLISNAVKFSHPNGRVVVQLAKDDGSLRIAVIDQGQGIPEEFRSRIFQKFAQVDSSDTRRRDGTGLGLSITKMIVERLGGSIHYESVLGKGTTFSVWFPIARSADDA